MAPCRLLGHVIHITGHRPSRSSEPHAAQIYRYRGVAVLAFQRRAQPAGFDRRQARIPRLVRHIHIGLQRVHPADGPAEGHRANNR